jgi:hypothetical protein
MYSSRIRRGGVGPEPSTMLDRGDRMLLVLQYQPMAGGGEEDSVGPQPSTMVDRGDRMLLVLQYHPMAVGGD